jgi:hypothetical protein
MKKNQKTLLIVGIVIAVILIILFVFFGFFYVSKKKTKTGWVKRPNYILVKGIRDSKREAAKEQCHDEGGRWSCAEDCAAIACDFGFEDIGKACTNSDQCQGTCMIDKETVEAEYREWDYKNQRKYDCLGDCIGECSKEEKNLDDSKEIFIIEDTTIEYQEKD